MICSTCLTDIDHGARCAGSNCRATIGVCCFEGDGLCSECRVSTVHRPIRCDDLTPELQAILWAGIGRPMPRCPRTGDAPDACECVDFDEECRP